MEKVTNQRGEVAVIINNDYGAGFSTWNTSYPEFLFHPTLVNLILQDRNSEITKELLVSLARPLIEDDQPFLGSPSTLEVVWIKKGKLFRISEYDGLEKVSYADDYDFIEA